MDTFSPEKMYCKVRKRKTKKCLNQLRNSYNKENVNNQFTRHKRNVLKEKKTNDTITKVVSLKNITKNRINIKHGFFAKGSRSETFSRIGLTEEFKARSEGNLHKIIDLANGSPDNIVSKLTKTYECLNRKKDITFNKLSLSKVSQCENNELPEVEYVSVRSPSPIFKSPEPQKLVRNVSVGHMSPLKFTSKPVTKTLSKYVHLTRNVENKAKASKTNPLILEDYTHLYKDFMENISSEFSKRLPRKTTDNTQNLKKYLQSVYFKTFQDEKINFLAPNVTDFNPKSTTHSYDLSKNIVLLNPMQYLKTVNETTKVNRKNTSSPVNKYDKAIRDKNDAKSCIQSSKVLVQNQSQSKLFHSQCFSPEISYAASHLRKETEIHPFNLKFLNGSPDTVENGSVYRSLNDETLSEHTIDLTTPEPVFFPRRLNFNN